MQGVCWVSSMFQHVCVCVEGNKGVDNLAKNATEKQRIEFTLQHGPPECTEIIEETVKDRWQNTWRDEGNGM